MTVRELYQILDTKIPSSLSYEWDNDGLMCCPDSNAQVKKVLVALDVTDSVADMAIDGGYDLIISHHPFVFKGIKALDDKRGVSARAIRLLKNNIAVFSFHTRLDCLEGGVNDRLCELLGIQNAVPVIVDGLPLGRVGNLKEKQTAQDFAVFVKRTLEAPAVLLSEAKNEVSRVCVVGGSGADALEAACMVGADTFVSGRVGYHEMTDAGQNGIQIIEAGHFYTENPICKVLSDMLGSIDKNIKCDICNSNIIKTI